MDYNDLIISMKRFGSSEDDICAYMLGIKPVGVVLESPQPANFLYKLFWLEF